jgi:hypothetical protein
MAFYGVKASKYCSKSFCNSASVKSTIIKQHRVGYLDQLKATFMKQRRLTCLPVEPNILENVKVCLLSPSLAPSAPYFSINSSAYSATMAPLFSESFFLISVSR